MKIRLGTLIPGATVLGVGIMGAVEGIAVFETGEERVIAKQLPEHELAAELFCAILARAVALPCPEPVLLQDTETANLLFGSIDAEYPNAAQAIQLDQKNPDHAAIDRLMALVRSWPAASQVASFDTWIDNRDRNPSNWLWRGPNDFLIIDHGKALGVDPSYPEQNLLHTYLMHALAGDAKGQADLKRSMVAHALTFGEPMADTALAALDDAALERFALLARGFYTLLITRLGELLRTVNNLFPGSLALF